MTVLLPSQTSYNLFIPQPPFCFETCMMCALPYCCGWLLLESSFFCSFLIDFNLAQQHLTTAEDWKLLKTIWSWKWNMSILLNVRSYGGSETYWDGKGATPMCLMAAFASWKPKLHKVKTTLHGCQLRTNVWSLSTFMPVQLATSTYLLC